MGESDIVIGGAVLVGKLVLVGKAVLKLGIAVVSVFGDAFDGELLSISLVLKLGSEVNGTCELDGASDGRIVGTGVGTRKIPRIMGAGRPAAIKTSVTARSNSAVCKSAVATSSTICRMFITGSLSREAS